MAQESGSDAESSTCSQCGEPLEPGTNFCGHCGAAEEMFPGGDTAAMAAAMSIPYFGSVAFDPRLAAASDRGTPFVLSHPDTPAGEALLRIARTIQKQMEAA